MRVLVLVVLAACSPAPVQRVPGGSLTPHLGARLSARARDAAQACGYDVALDGHAAPDIRYRYALDALGRVAHVTGTYATGPDDSIDYAYDHLDHMTHMIETRTYGGQRVEVTQRYDTLGDMTSYALSQGLLDQRTYTYSAFTDSGQPTREVIAILHQPDISYELDYDASDRITRAAADGEVTTYTYDDDGRTMTLDTNNGAYHGVVIYDDHNDELSESWDGTDPSVIASQNTYDWDGDRLLSITYRSGTQDFPHDLQTFEVDTLRYECATR
jgi:hypothetical protein